MIELQNSNNDRNNSRSLDELGMQLNLDQSSLRHGYLARYEALLPAPSVAKINIVLFGHSKIAIGEANALNQYYPHSRVTLVTTKKEPFEADIPDGIKGMTFENIDELSLYLISQKQIDLFIEHGNNRRSQKKEVFFKAFPTLAPNGLYCIEDTHANLIEKYSDSQESILDDIFKIILIRTMDPSRKDEGPGKIPVDTFAAATFFDRLLVVRRSDANVAGRISERQSSRFFEWSKNILSDNFEIHPAEIVNSKAEIRTNQPDLLDQFPPQISMPAAQLRVYEDAVCLPGQIVMKGNAILPESFRMPRQKEAKNRHLEQFGTFYARPRQPAAAPQNLTGSYLYLDNEHDDHYGHITVEIISKLWAWDEAIQRWPDLRVLAGASKGQVSPVLLKLLEMYGIPAARVTPLTAPAQVERLICPTQLYHIGRYASPRLMETWDKLTRAGQTEMSNLGRKIFLSRTDGLDRGCRNQKDVEDIFAEAGYDIVLPEKFSLNEQITLLSKATAIGGFAGSAMLNAIYSRPNTPKTVIASETFNAGNDYIISTLKGGLFNYIFCPSEIQHPKNGWSEKAFMSPYSFDLARDAELLRSLIQDA